MDTIKDFSISKYEQNCVSRHQTVTLFMTTYKRPDYLKLAIESVLKQTYSNFYLIVLDNMSRDNTKEVVGAFNDERVIYIEHDGNLTGSNFVYAFQLVKTKYIVVIHDDDILERSYLETMLSTICNHDELTALSPTHSIIDSNGILQKEGVTFEEVRVYKNSEYFMQMFIRKTLQQGMIFPAVMYNTDLLGNISDYLDKRTGPAGDQFIWFEICRKGGKIGIVGRPLINYRIHNNQDSMVHAGTMILDLLSFLFTIDYYSDILSENSSLVSMNIRVAWINSLDNYRKGIYAKEDLKNVYLRIPSVLSKNRKCRIYMIGFRAAIICPKLASTVMDLLRRIKRK